MTSNEATLRALHSRQQFDVARNAAAVSQAAALTRLAARRASTDGQRCAALIDELRGLMQRPPIDPSLLAALQRLHHTEQLAWHDSQARLNSAHADEAQLRGSLAEARNRERALQRALQDARRQRQLRQLDRDLLEADEIWLQQGGRTFP